jgi:hypothetical protein
MKGQCGSRKKGSIIRTGVFGTLPGQPLDVKRHGSFAGLLAPPPFSLWSTHESAAIAFESCKFSSVHFF